MSYLIMKEWDIIPVKSPEIIRHCSKCKGKSHYVNTGNFRVNANGNCIDVWLIYQCKKCKTTYNLTIYERIKPGKLLQEEYQKFLSNDGELAMKCGFDSGVAGKNKVKLDFEQIEYNILEKTSPNTTNNLDEQRILIHNEHGLKVRLNKLLSDKLDISGTKIKKMMEKGFIYCKEIENLEKVWVSDGLEIFITLNY